ncbi:MAG: rhamnan synthesis F family protein, partial [Desulfobacterales bacterium]
MQVAEGNSTLNDSEVQSCLQHASACINELSPAFNYMDRQGWKLSALNQILSEREGLIETIRQQNSQLQKQTEELKALSNDLQKETENIYMTLSWRITKPLRRMSRWKNKVLRLVQVYQNYRLVHPGVEGLTLLYRRLIDSIRDEGFRGLYSRFSEQESNSLVNSLPLPSKPVLLLNDVNVEHVSLPEDVAVHAHVYYPELAIEVKSYLENIPVKFHLYATTDTLEKARSIEDVFSGMANVQELDIRVTENIGRDICPMLVTLGDELVKHDLVLHIHTKRSPHNAWMLGGWRRYMMELLIGNSQRISAIFQLFAQDHALGILFPEPYSPVKTLIQKYNTANDYNMKKLLRLAGKKETELKKIDRSFFPAGDMFWFRGPSLKPFLDMRLTAQSFEFECGQVDATLAHAIERMFPYFAEVVGLITKSYASKSYCSNQIDLFRDFIKKGLISDPVLLFDHDIGGGTNVYTRELVKTILDDGGMVLRIYYREASWIIQWISNDDGMFFNAHSTTELFSALAISESSSIIVNSLYGCPDFKKVIFNIIELVRLLRVSLDIKVHDFLALCPSPHLLDFN